MDKATITANRKRFFETCIERIREIRTNMEALAAEAVKIGLPNASFNRWRASLDRQEKGFQAKLDRLL